MYRSIDLSIYDLRHAPRPTAPGAPAGQRAWRAGGGSGPGGGPAPGAPLDPRARSATGQTLPCEGKPLIKGNPF